ncbi:linoleate 9S-lipoxygenase 6-like [Aristolochia californica]|uniref:linoleate 9S-lipoxygenase 6-like n=1 Tax=Aristolochia californica TaxID=171875 RepID=UPI0035DE65CD
MQVGWWTSLSDCLHSCSSPSKTFVVIKGCVVIRRNSGQSGPRRSASIQLYSSTEVDNSTLKGKLSEKAYLKDDKSVKEKGSRETRYRVEFHVEREFGTPGALVIQNQHKHEFFLKFVKLEISRDQTIHFDCNSWVYPYSKTKSSRLFFSNKSYLPSGTPEALRELRKEELRNLRGNGRGERKEWERIYDYDYYNDLANPDKGPEHERPVLGGSRQYPYPRRGRTGRARSAQDPRTESRPEIISLDFYVPPDERFSPKKQSKFISKSVQAIVQFLIPEAKSLFEESNSFQSFDEIFEIFEGNRNHVVGGSMIEKLEAVLPKQLFGRITHESRKENPTKFPLPQIIAASDSAWKEDEEFGREMLAGLNPVVIRGLETFPPESKSGEKSSIRAWHVENNLDGLSLEQAMGERRLFILDHYDYLMPFVERINSQGVCIYASRTLLFRRENEALKPLAIELSLPYPKGDDPTSATTNDYQEVINRVFLPATHGTERALWQLAKAHVASNDSSYHQLVSHWLNTHAVAEPFIIATRRQLSQMHPIHKLLDPHFKDTMHINALARSILLNSEGILEKTLFPGKFSLELTSALYKDWKFDEQGLPADLLKRRMAVEDPLQPSGVRLLFTDYPYAADGLEIWTAIHTWVSDYCSFYYSNDAAVVADTEIQSWWTEIRIIGHGDKSGERWWYQLNSVSHLTNTLTTLIWIASALHASVNFGQYAYAGFIPNRPSMCRKFIPVEGTPEFAEFLRDPDKYFLEMLPERLTATLGVALIEILSTHMSDEVYLGRRASSEWTDNPEVLLAFEKFGDSLQHIQKKISERNIDPKLNNRRGPAKIPYTLLYPDTSSGDGDAGITGKGIPNSVSI